jgi:pyruvate formate lyase activating enzyme
MIKALLAEPLETGQVICHLCAHECRIVEGGTGICRVRKNIGGELFSLNADRIVAMNIDPIEKKPMYHFMPGSQSLSIAAMGCNFSCRFCQNHSISIVQEENAIQGDKVSPDQLVALAQKNGTRSISYTYTEPTVFFELVLETARLARSAGIRNVLVSNGYLTPQALDLLGPFLDGANIDLKSFNDDFYKKYCSARLQPVLRTIEAMKAMDIWVEVTTLLIPGLNDDRLEIDGLLTFLRGIDANIPWHASRFFPNYHLCDVPPTEAGAIHGFLQLAEEKGLNFAYGGNLADSRWSHTRCPHCQKNLLERSGYHAANIGLQAGHCRFCGAEIPGIWQ